ncbi:hypothetical protein BC939DRAFT_516116 [Gamsiella multidivaricata]|uniref:uncharacterized protein n=1 Tax=Gamsiella multidivaricata TaxID=101098 RepID=UPI00221F28DE|nr:uncharacterized protein BC939DRAFT_516116 [Gamsiella multidivaricata]KAI7831831.1 hypothetical protein BC939DRAFT_516116 [Gamsiella multidivaricata]
MGARRRGAKEVVFCSSSSTESDYKLLSYRSSHQFLAWSILTRSALVRIDRATPALLIGLLFNTQFLTQLSFTAHTLSCSFIAHILFCSFTADTFSRSFTAPTLSFTVIVRKMLHIFIIAQATMALKACGPFWKRKGMSPSFTILPPNCSTSPTRLITIQ